MSGAETGGKRAEKSHERSGVRESDKRTEREEGCRGRGAGTER